MKCVSSTASLTLYDCHCFFWRACVLAFRTIILLLFWTWAKLARHWGPSAYDCMSLPLCLAVLLCLCLCVSVSASLPRLPHFSVSVSLCLTFSVSVTRIKLFLSSEPFTFRQCPSPTFAFEQVSPADRTASVRLGLVSLSPSLCR